MNDKSFKKEFVASVSEIKSSELYMTVKATQFTVPEANLNGVRCTEEFMRDIVANQEAYIGLPLVADVESLIHGDYENLGHCYDPYTDRFYTSQIGSFYRFEIEETGEEKKLIGYARIMKRSKAVCQAIADLFVRDALKFSFEIACGTFSTLDDGTFLIDKDPSNYLEGMCVVSFPACPDAIAMQLIAELKINGANKSQDREANDMPEKVIAEEVQETEEVIAETAPEVTEEVIGEQNTEQVQTPEVEVVAEEAQPEETVETAEKSEEQPEDSEEETAECKDDDKEEKKYAELVAAIEALTQKFETLTAELAEMKAEPQVEEPVGVHPFVAEINTPKQYTLLDKVESREWTLLDKA